jgi:hypothetical protein
MTKKDYELIAGSVWRSVRSYEWIEKNKVKREAKRNALHLVATDLSARLAHDNPKFDKDKFMTACGF